MRITKLFIALIVFCGLILMPLVNVQAKQIRYQFRFLTQGASAFAPAKNRKIQLRFKTNKKSIFNAVTDSQGNATFLSSRCKEDDPAELIFRSDMPDKTTFRVPVTISCGTEDSPATAYNFGIYSLTYGKFLVSNYDDLDGPCYDCKSE
jgi:hypothetical protein